jgi:predicted O-methyltransferase YrrM
VVRPFESFSTERLTTAYGADVIRRRVIDLARAVARRLRSVRVERRLRRTGDRSARAVADGLRAARRTDFSPESERWFARIEALRAELAAPNAVVEVVGYGAGLPWMSRTDEEMRTGIVSHASIARSSTFASVPEVQGRLLHAIVAALAPTRAVELGTCLGLSAAYQSSAQAPDGSATFVTCEGASALAEIAAANLRRLDLGWARVVPGRFDDTVPQLAHDLAPVGYAFIDGHHDEAATLRYFDVLRAHAASGAVFVFDDIRWSDGMTRAWHTIASSPAVTAAADLGRFGLVVLGTEPAGRATPAG